MKAKTADKIATAVLYIIAGAIVVLLAAFIIYLLYEGRESLNFSFIFGNNVLGGDGGGIGPQLFNTIYLLIISLIITVPIGVGAGIYLAEYAGNCKIVEIIRLCIETMSSLPSIVVGLFGLLVFVTYAGWRYSIIAGALSVGILNLPYITRISENAIRAASKNIKEASLGLGATRWQTVIYIILPAAFPDLLTGLILASGRIFGEAASLLYTAGMTAPRVHYYLFNLFSQSPSAQMSAFNLFRPAETLAVYIYSLNAESIVSDTTKIINGTAAVLIILVLIFNFGARFLGNYIHKRYTGEK